MAIRAKDFGVLFLILTVTLLSGNYNQGLARSVEEERALIEGAKKEGKIVCYAAGDIQLSKLYLDAFREKYPFIKTELMALKSEVIPYLSLLLPPMKMPPSFTIIFSFPIKVRS